MVLELNRYLIIGILFLFVVYGCIDLIRGANDYTDDYFENFSYMSAYDTADMCKVGYCKCFVCKNRTAWFGLLTSFAGGECKFEPECNEEKFTSFYEEDSEYTMRNFMIGAGPSFADFGEANRYCHHSLTMAVHWLTGSERIGYDLPDAGRALCMLQMGVMPVYVLYSGGENIDIRTSYNISHTLGHDAFEITGGRISGPVGPVIITTEIDYNNTPDTIDQIVDQIQALNDGCENDYSDPDNPVINCYIAVAPKMGDKEALDAVMNHPSLRTGRVHMLAFGINSHYDNGTCSGARMRTDAASFARYGLYEYGLPSVIPYVLFDSGTTDSTETCTWSESDVREGYAGFFPKGIMSLRGVGVIGIAPYDFNTSTTGGDPLRCDNCALGASSGRLASWYGGCQDLTALGEQRKAAGMPIIFPNESGGYCDFGVESNSIFYMFDAMQEEEFFETTTHVLEEPDNESFFRCDACLIQSNKSPDYYFDDVLDGYIPDGFPSHLSDLCPECADEEKDIGCYIYPEIDYYSSKFSIDPFLLRATIWKESNFHPCSTAKVCRPGYSGEDCLEGKYSSGYNYMYFPEELSDPHMCQEHLNMLMEASGIYEVEDPSIEDPEPKYRFAGLGLAQVMESPYDFWPAEYSDTGDAGPYSDLFEITRDRDEGRQENVWGAKACSPQFNPYNTSDAACMGARKLRGTFETGRDWVDRKNGGCSGAPDLFGIGGDASKRDILAAFAASYRYAGVWSEGYDEAYECRGKTPLDCWADEYCQVKGLRCSELSSSACSIRTGCKQNSITGECELDTDVYPCYDEDENRGNGTDFLKYSLCLMKDHGLIDEDGEPQKLSIDVGYKTLGRYAYLYENCPNNFCPPWERPLNIDPSLAATMPECFDGTDNWACYEEEGAGPETTP